MTSFDIIKTVFTFSYSVSLSLLDERESYTNLGYMIPSHSILAFLVTAATYKNDTSLFKKVMFLFNKVSLG
jgi:hypothetical protein